MLLRDLPRFPTVVLCCSVGHPVLKLGERGEKFMAATEVAPSVATREANRLHVEFD